MRLLERLSRAEGFEQYLRRAFLGQKQFSLEGLDVMVPMLDESIELAAASGAHEVVIGMAHRGRLNVLAHTVGRSYESILREFEGERTIHAVVESDEGGTGDVKYHLSAVGVRHAEAGDVTITLAPNPSHLEAVDPVVLGWTRAEQTDRSGGAGIHDPSVALPILIHGDASFAGQGVVAETLNLSSLEGYTTGGTLHLIANNQVGFTTDPAEGRSTRYSSDLAKGFDIPIVHVNANDPEAAISAIRLALAYREEFGHDFVVDLIGYRRFGHNEQDEAAYTQPLMVAQIAEQPTARDQLLGPPGRGGRADRRGGRGGLRGDAGEAAGGARAPEGVDRRAARAEGEHDPGRHRRGRRHRRSCRPARDAERAASGAAGRLRGEREAARAARAAPRDAPLGRDRLGPGGSTGLREPAD